MGYGLANNNQPKERLDMKTKLKYIIAASLLFGASGFNSAKAITADELLVAVQQFAGQVGQVFTQVGQALGDHETRISDNDARTLALEASMVALQDTVTTQATIIAGLQSEIDILEGHAIAASIDIETINNSNVMALNPYITVDGIDNRATLSGINLQIVSGSGFTNAAPNGLGNLIVGYDEVNTGVLQTCSDGSFDNESDCRLGEGVWSNSHKSGSHYVVTGFQNSYSQFGGIVSGANNVTNGAFSTVSGGQGNTASGEGSSVSGGQDNIASGQSSSVSGGDRNTASGGQSSVSGGVSNISNSGWSSVSGGQNNIASGSRSSVSGGLSNTASNTNSSVSGGRSNTAIGVNSSVSGGRNNTSIGLESSVSGGNFRSAPTEADWAAGTLLENF